MARRKPSVTRMIKGLERMAHDAEARAASMRELGFPNYAHSISAAANAFSDAAIMLERQLK